MILRLFIAVFLVNFNVNIVALRLRGQFSTDEFVRLLTKFGIQKTDQHRSEETFGYIFGNVTIDCSAKSSDKCSMLTNRTSLFLILDFDYFLPMFNRQQTKSCSEMMKNIQTVAFDRQCNEQGGEDFWRRIPCRQNQLCPDEDQPKNVLPNQQFTFKIRDINQPRFWYLSFVSCFWNPINCQWEKIDEIYRVNYDISIVNGNPEATKRENRLEYHFSFDMHDVAEIYLTCLLLYIVFPFPFLIFKMRQWKFFQHPILFSYFFFQIFFFLGNVFNFVHLFIFAFDGVGFDLFVHIGNLLTIVGESILILLLLFIAKGWLVNSPVLRQAKKTVILFVLYTIACCSCYLLSIVTVNRVVDSNRFQTFANYFSLLFRCFFMLLFVFELKQTTQEEKVKEKLQFFHHFGACCMVWFIYPTALIFIMSFVTELYRVKLIISVVTIVNFLSILIMSYILFSPKTFLNLPKISSVKNVETTKNSSTNSNGFHKSVSTEAEEEDEENEIEIYGPSHLLLNNSLKK